MGGGEDCPAPQPTTEATAAAASRASIDSQRRRFAGMPNSSIAARTAPPHPNCHRFSSDGRARLLVELAVVVTVNWVVPLPPAASVTLAGFKLHAGRPCAPDGEVVRAQAMFMEPEYVLSADRVTVAVALAPGFTADRDGTVITT